MSRFSNLYGDPIQSSLVKTNSLYGDPTKSNLVSSSTMDVESTASLAAVNPYLSAAKYAMDIGQSVVDYVSEKREIKSGIKQLQEQSAQVRKQALQTQLNIMDTLAQNIATSRVSAVSRGVKSTGGDVSHSIMVGSETANKDLRQVSDNRDIQLKQIARQIKQLKRQKKRAGFNLAQKIVGSSIDFTGLI